MKRILVVGNGKSGSWKIRGEQLGRAIGATVDPFAENGAKGFDLAIVVKRTRADVLQRLRAAGVPLVWDIVDAWPQPVGNTWDQAKCITWLRNAIAAMQPHALVTATRQMLVDARTPLPAIALPHHVRPGLKRNPVRPEVRKVGYEGGEHYLGKWRAVLERECAARGWEFVVNPPDLADLDIVVALRDCPGYAPEAWKSNVKLANAQGSGTPFIGVPEMGYVETKCGAELWAHSEVQLIKALNKLTSFGMRAAISEQLREHAKQYSLDVVAQQYAYWLEDL